MTPRGRARTRTSCDGAGGCTDGGFKDDTTECGKPGDGICDLQDTCSGVDENCIDRVKGEGSACGDHNDTTCSAPDTCDDSGECLPNNRPCSFVTSSSLCTFDFDQTLEERQFNAIFTPAADQYPAYKTNATNPGQFFYNAIVEEEDGVVVEGDSGPLTRVTMIIPWPFITQGAMPVHVYDAADIEVIGDEPTFCFRDEFGNPPVGGTAFPATITPLDRKDGSFKSGSAYTVDCGTAVAGASYPPGVNGQPGYDCAVTVEFPMPASGRAYVNIHLDYGVKGSQTDANPINSAADRYDMGGNSCTGDAPYYHALVNTSDNTGAVALATCTTYPFSHQTDYCDPGELTCSGDDFVQNVNTFKKFSGIAVQAISGGGPVGGVPLKIKKGTVILESGVTDADGFFAFVYKHTGKAAQYQILLEGAINKTALVTLKGNGWATATYDKTANGGSGAWTLEWK